MRLRWHAGAMMVVLPLFALCGCASGALPSTRAAVAVDPSAQAFDQVSGARLSEQEVLLRLRGARTILLGEVHDNAVQHRLRAALLRQLLATGPLTVVFEQIDRERQPQLDAWAASRPADPLPFDERHDRGADVQGQRGTGSQAQQRGTGSQAQRKKQEAQETQEAQQAQQAQVGQDSPAMAALLAAADFDRRGWRWPLHAPILQVALDPRVRVVGGGVSRERVRKVVRGGEAEVPADLLPSIAPAGLGGWTAAADAALAADLQAGHCGQLPDSIVPKMALGQRVRDAALAAGLRPPMKHADASFGEWSGERSDKTSGKQSAQRPVEPFEPFEPFERRVLIAGNGHVRRDVGVPRYLDASAGPVVAIGFIEQRPGEPTRPEHPAGQGDARARYDIVWLTAPAPREDPCVGFVAPAR